ncbi:MAG: endo-1,4-beta-xylanase [Bacteroidaceae bacterium]|nr:endo-1,4-beta-xylanase [Bacteroidaceae bacterium]
MHRLLPIKTLTSAMILSLTTLTASAQLSQNPDKFLGNITTRYSVDVSGVAKYSTMWNQITCENESKWSSIQGNRGSFNWGGSDNAFNYAKNNKFPFKFHALIWGAQYPSWLPNLSPSERYEAIVTWMDAIKKHYPKLELIDVVNEAIGMHQQGNPMMKESLGGEGVTGYDWLIKAFELAYERWPDAILIYNDYNSLNPNNGDVDNYIKLVKTLRDAGAPIDAYGNQSHDVTNISASTLKSVIKKQQDALKMPMYITELDIDIENDTQQKNQYQSIFPVMWEADCCAGITLWGYIHGATWVSNSGLIKDGVDRPAMTWLRDYMKEDRAKTAKSPYPGMKKEASLYVKAAGWNVPKNDSIPITVRLKMRTKTVDHVDLYIRNKYYTTMTEAPYVAYYKPITQGTYDLKAIVTCTDSSKYERLASFNVTNTTRRPFNENLELPGTIEAEDFDIGADGLTYHDSDTKNDGVRTYRANAGGVDILAIEDGYVVGHTQKGEWVEYTVNVKEAGLYKFEAIASAGAYNSSFKLTLSNYDVQEDLTDDVPVQCAELGEWDNFMTVNGRMLVPLKEGKQKIRLNITGGQCHIDKIKFSRVDVDESIKVTVKAAPSTTVTVGNKVTVRATATSSSSTIAAVKIFENGVLDTVITESPYTAEIYPNCKGTCVISAIAYNTEGQESVIAKTSVTVKNKRVPFVEMSVPGIIEAEDFDKGGEGLTFHDSDEKDEGAAKYRKDNEGADIIKKTGGYALGYTVANEWYDYTVNVTQSEKFSFKATVASSVETSKFTISMVRGTTVYSLATVEIPKTGSTYKVVEGTFNRSMAVGQQTIRITITGDKCNIDKLEIIGTDTAIDDINLDIQANKPATIYNINGQRQNGMQRGINIINGKKVLVR